MGWLDLHSHMDGNLVAVNFDLVTTVHEASEGGSVLFFSTGPHLHVREGIAEIWGE